MKQFNTLLLSIACILALSTLQAQTRYLDQVFNQVSVERNVKYGTNISILTGAPASLDLLMDVYSPVGDTASARPTVIYLHTGSFLPQYFNGQITGGRSDSTVVEICTRLAKMGYTAIAATYRQGWLPLAVDQNVRTSTLLQAAYRGIQDTRTCIRFLRKTVAEDENPFKVDPDRIVLWGQGTGGYLSMGCAFLDSYDEVVIDKFINTETFQPYVLEPVHGDVYGIQQAAINIPNWPTYSSDFAMAVNMGGALGDSTWIDGKEGEPPVIGYHVLTDPFAPFGDGPVIVPTTQEFVVDVSGTRTAVGRANALGVNTIMDPVLDIPSPLTAYVNFLKPIPVNLAALGQAPTTLATDHIYPFLTPGNRLESGPWDWWSKPLLDAIIPQVNAVFGTTFSSDTLDYNGRLTNPDMSAAKARRYIDTIMAYYAPRACFALNLAECGLVSTENLVDVKEVDLKVSPNPSAGSVYFESNPETPIRDIYLFDLNGRLVTSTFNVQYHQYRLDREKLPPGVYIAKVRFDKGVAAQKIILK